jgi:hypothetical protein
VAPTRRPSLAAALANGSLSGDDGWGGLYRFFERQAPPGSRLRGAICAYFEPSRLERSGDGRLFRVLGVGVFGRFIPTGGIAIRRATGAAMRPYTLHERSLRGARDFYYRACVFEALHLPFFLALAALAAQRYSIGRIDYAVQETLINLVVNLFPMLHHRHTRTRILQLLHRARQQRGAGAGPSSRPDHGGSSSGTEA